MAKSARETRNKELVRTWRTSHNFEVLTLLIDNNRRLIESITRAHGIHDATDQLSIAYEALSKALLSVDVEKGSFFEWYRGYLRNASRGRLDEDRLIRFTQGRLSAYQQSIRRVDVQLSTMIDDDRDDLSERMEREARIEAVKRALSRMGKSERSIISMRFNQKMSYRELSARTGNSVKRVRESVRRILDSLKCEISVTLTETDQL